MVWLLDSNVLAALRLDSHPHHQRAHRWFARTARDRFATCAITQGALLRLHMRFAPDPSAAAAWQALREICAHPRHEYWDDGFSYLEVDHRLLQGPQQVTDAWLAALARKRKARVATLDAAFATLHPDVAVIVPPL
jgi:hypothetical protein